METSVKLLSGWKTGIIGFGNKLISEARTKLGSSGKAQARLSQIEARSDLSDRKMSRLQVDREPFECHVPTK